MGVSHACQFLILLFCLIETSLLGLLLFNQGFLLTREELTLNSTCNDFQQDENSFDFANDLQNTDCWYPKRYKKAIIILIDALRYDMTNYNKSFGENGQFHYQNKLPIFSQMLKDKGESCRLYKFIADAPTTTMQRLKGLTTGSLPTFIDARNNFAR